MLIKALLWWLGRSFQSPDYSCFLSLFFALVFFHILIIHIVIFFFGDVADGDGFACDLGCHLQRHACWWGNLGIKLRFEVGAKLGEGIESQRQRARLAVVGLARWLTRQGACEIWHSL